MLMALCTDAKSVKSSHSLPAMLQLLRHCKSLNGDGMTAAKVLAV